MSYASMPSFSFILLTISEKKNFEKNFENLPFMSPRQPIKSSDLDKSRVKHGGLLNKHFCKNKNQIFSMTWQKLSISTFPISNQSSYPTEIKNITFVEGNVLSKYAKFRLHPPYGFWEEDF